MLGRPTARDQVWTNAGPEPAFRPCRSRGGGAPLEARRGRRHGVCLAGAGCRVSGVRRQPLDVPDARLAGGSSTREGGGTGGRGRTRDRSEGATSSRHAGHHRRRHACRRPAGGCPARADLLADRGITFRNSFAPDPLCAPSRASFLTGRYVHNHRVLGIERPYGFRAFDDSSTLATRLRRAGYRTALVGKYLNGYGKTAHVPRPHPSLHYVPPGWTQWWASTDHGWRWSVAGGRHLRLHAPDVQRERAASAPGPVATPPE